MNQIYILLDSCWPTASIILVCVGAKSGILEKINQSIFFIISYVFNNLSNFKIISFINRQKLWRGVQPIVPNANVNNIVPKILYRLIFGNID